MTSISEILEHRHIRLQLDAANEAEAVLEVLSTLDGDRRVKSFASLSDAVNARDAAGIVENGCGICIAHGRTETVSSLVMAAGRSVGGVPAREGSGLVKLFFVVGIPSAFSSDYLRVVGAIARICRDRHQLNRLLAAKTTRNFFELLVAGEVKL